MLGVLAGKVLRQNVVGIRVLRDDAAGDEEWGLMEDAVLK